MGNQYGRFLCMIFNLIFAIGEKPKKTLRKEKYLERTEASQVDHVLVRA